MADNDDAMDGSTEAVELDSVVTEGELSLLPPTLVVVTGFKFDVPIEEATTNVLIEDDVVLVAVPVIAVVTVTDVLVVVIGVDSFFPKTCAVPKPNRSPQYLLSSISSSKYISFIRKNV